MHIKTAQEIKIMREAGKRLAEVLRKLKTSMAIGVTTEFLDKLGHDLILEAGAEPAFLNYCPAGAEKPYPATICASLNDTVVHGLPSQKKLKNGDIVSLDIGLKYKGFYSDMAITVGIGKIDARAQKLLETTRTAMELGIRKMHPGNTLGDVGWAIESHIQKNGFAVVKNLCGHGIGRNLHEDPAVLNFGRPGEGEPIVSGMVLAIEPMVALGSGRIKQIADDSYVTADGSLAAHFEHTVVITEIGPEILTQ